MTPPTVEGRAMVSLGQTVATLQQDNARLRAQVTALVAVVEAVEWGPDDDCPWCGEHRDIMGHMDCALASALALVKEGE